MRRPSHGFSLIEITVVVAILAGLAGTVVLSIGGLRRAEVRKSAARLAGAMRFAFDRALTTSRTYRLVLDLNQQKYWAETTDDRFLLPYDKQRALEEEEEERRDREGAPDDDEGMVPADPFARFGIPGDPAVRLPRARFKEFRSTQLGRVELGRARIHGVWTAGEVEPLAEGEARLYYFPQGFCERAILHIGEEDAIEYSLLQHPLTGRVKIEPGEVEIPTRDAELDDLGEEIPQ